MRTPPLDQQFEDRLTLLESSDAESTIVPDLPLRDFLIAVVGLVAVVVALTWWAY